MRFLMFPAAEPARSGAPLALDGPTPPAAGVRVSFAGGPPVASDGPFIEAREALGGCRLIRVRSRLVGGEGK